MTVGVLKQILSSYSNDTEVFVQFGMSSHSIDDITEDEDSGNLTIVPAREIA